MDYQEVQNSLKSDIKTIKMAAVVAILIFSWTACQIKRQFFVEHQVIW